jgi:hypothetical protein
VIFHKLSWLIPFVRFGICQFFDDLSEAAYLAVPGVCIRPRAVVRHSAVAKRQLGETGGTFARLRGSSQRLGLAAIRPVVLGTDFDVRINSSLERIDLA